MSKNSEIPPRLLSQLPPGLVLFQNEYEKKELPEPMAGYEVPNSVASKMPKSPPPVRLASNGSQSTLHESFYEYLEQPCQESNKRTTFRLFCAQNCIWCLVIFNVLFVTAGTLAYFYFHRADFDDAPPISRTCSSGYSFLEETRMCYRADAKMINFIEAQKACHWDHAQLVSIHSSGENDFVVELAKQALRSTGNVWEYRYRTWTGLTYQNDSFQWTDGSQFDWANFEKPVETMERRGEVWATMLLETSKPTKASNNLWIHEPPEFGNSFVCKKAPV